MEGMITSEIKEQILFSKHPFASNTEDNFTHEHLLMVNIEIRLIAFSVAEDEDTVYSQQKQDLDLTGSEHQLLYQNSGLN